MKMRPRIPVSGARAWVTANSRVALPDGLEHRTPVTIVSTDDRPRLTVATDDGRTFQLSYRQYDTGSDYCGPAGNWLPEEHPKVRAALQQELDRHRSQEPPASASARYAWEQYGAQLQWVIERNGL
jgi:hypothetical protein